MAAGTDVISGALRRWRWGVVGVSLATLAAVPAVVASIPVSATSPGATELLQRIAGSGAVPYRGTVDAVGRLPLPDIANLDEPVSLLGDANRLRVWFAGADRYRIDQLSLFGENGTYVDGGNQWRWESERRQATQSTVASGYRLPRALDLTPPELGRRLAALAQPGDVLEDLPADRVAGRAVPGVRIRPQAGTATTVDHADVWADASTGLVLRAEVTAVGANRPAVGAQFRDLAIGPVSDDLVTFDASGRIRTRSGSSSFDPIAVASAVTSGRLPVSIGDVARTDDTTSGVGLYGQGFGTVAVAALTGRLLPRGLDTVFPAAPRPWGGSARYLGLGVVNVMAIESAGITYVLAGALPEARLDALAAALSREVTGR